MTDSSRGRYFGAAIALACALVIAGCSDDSADLSSSRPEPTTQQPTPTTGPTSTPTPLPNSATPPNPTPAPTPTPQPPPPIQDLEWEWITATSSGLGATTGVNGMVHFRDLYVAVGKVGPYDAGESDAAVFVSENGIDWEQITSDSFGGPGQQRMNSIALGGPGLVAAGFEDLVPGVDMEADAAVWVSSDARTWERVRDPGLRSAGTHEEIHNIVAAGPGLVASGWGYDADEDWDTQVWISPDGFQWERITQGFDTPGFQSVFDGGSAHSATNASTIVIVGRHNPTRGPWLPAIWVSANGRTWESASLDIETQGELVGVTANADGQGFVAVGFTYSNEAEVDALVLTSDDGRSWQRVTSPSLERPGTQRMLGVIQYGRGYVAVGGGADNSQDFVPMIWHSPNGLDWEQINSPQIDQAPVEWASHAVSTSTGLIIHTLGPDLLIGIATQPN